MTEALAAPSTPPRAHPLFSIPTYLQKWPSWAAWVAPVKKPLDLRRGLRNADVTHPDNWAPFSNAAAYLDKAAIRSPAPPTLPLPLGVGILVAPPLVFVDFDDMITEDSDSQPPPWATAFLQRAADIGAFTEWSGSGTGAHAFIRVSPAFPNLTRNRYTRSGNPSPVGIELYSSGRFAALTGFPYFPHSRPDLNIPTDGDLLLTAFIADLGVQGAPVLSPHLLGPIAVPPPTSKVLALASELAALPLLARAFENPQAEFMEWALRRTTRSLDPSLSAWRFYLYGHAARQCPHSPLPLYELFNPSTTPQHPGIPEWQSQSGYLKKKHRVYHDIQRAHALVVEEHRLLALDLGEPPPPPPSRAPRHVANTDLADSWAQLGLAMRVTKDSAVPVVGSVNFMRVVSKHSHFQQYKIERNSLDGTTRVNRSPIPDTLATRLLEPLRGILDMPHDPPIQAVRDSIEVIADDNPYDPLQEYINGLAPYDHTQEPAFLSTWLERIGATPDHDLERYSRRILLGLVARALNPTGVKFDYVPVFEGPQGVGKSTLVSALVTPDFYSVLSGDLQSKDARLDIRGKWGVELAEMSAFRKSDEQTRKAFFSTVADTFRPPYGRASLTIPRRSVFFGTTNDREYLSDYTGARRYWPIMFPREIDLRWFSEHRDRLFAEAAHYYRLKEPIFDSPEEMHAPERQALLEERMMTPAWHTRLINHLKSLPPPTIPSDESQGHAGVVTTQYVADLRSPLDLPPVVQNMSDAQLASFLRRAGYHAKTLSFRDPNKKSAKVYAWAHPAYLRLTDEQTKAVLSFFPGLFPNNSTPSNWIEHRADHLSQALRHLQAAE